MFKLTFSELISSLHAVDQSRTMRNEDVENKSENAFLAKSPNPKGKGKSLQCTSVTGVVMRKKIVGIRESQNVSIVKNLGIWQKIIG